MTNVKTLNCSMAPQKYGQYQFHINRAKKPLSHFNTEKSNIYCFPTHQPEITQSSSYPLVPGARCISSIMSLKKILRGRYICDNPKFCPNLYLQTPEENRICNKKNSGWKKSGRRIG